LVAEFVFPVGDDLSPKRLYAGMVDHLGKIMLHGFADAGIGDGPVLDQLAIEYEGKAKVAKVDVDVNIKTMTKFNVRSIPAILFFKDGKLVDQMIGFMGKPALAEKFKQHAAA